MLDKGVLIEAFASHGFSFEECDSPLCLIEIKRTDGFKVLELIGDKYAVAVFPTDIAKDANGFKIDVVEIVGSEWSLASNAPVLFSREPSFAFTTAQKIIDSAKWVKGSDKVFARALRRTVVKSLYERHPKEVKIPEIYIENSKGKAEVLGAAFPSKQSALRFVSDVIYVGRELSKDRGLAEAGASRFPDAIAGWAEAFKELSPHEDASKAVADLIHVIKSMIEGGRLNGKRRGLLLELLIYGRMKSRKESLSFLDLNKEIAELALKLAELEDTSSVQSTYMTPIGS